VVVLAASAASDVEVPKNDGWVTDLAGLLSPEEERGLELLMESYEEGSEHEIAVLTVEDLGGNPIENFALAVAREWGIGKEMHNGALFVVAKNDRKMRIEVGRGLEGALPDVVAARIIRDVVTPEFKRGAFPAGIRAGVVAMHSVIGGDYGPLEQSSRKRRGSGGAGGVFLFGFVFLILAISRRRGRGGGGTGGSGGLGAMLPRLVLSSMSSGGRSSSWSGGGSSSGGGGGFGGFGGFGGGGGFSGGGASGGW
jgi:uncharacterized protein